MTLPAVVIHAGKDLDVFPDTHSKATFAALASKDKQYWDFPDALHYFEPEIGENDSRTLDALMERLVPWIEERVPL